ncbi:hypothetical protein GOV12_06590 [Candidatus Pacearchaeota archaeon]|nr:hypothetical protein [Candidatus Pacearchaeota archaeon]
MGNRILVLVLVSMVLIGSIGLIIAIPNGGTLDPLSNSSHPGGDPAGTMSAYAGNVTIVNVDGVSTTASWQGYMGNVTGVVQLTNAANLTMYNWTLTNPLGEVYASNHSSITWTSVQCFNFTANGTNCADDMNRSGGSSWCGMNETVLETAYGMTNTSGDGINETFNRMDHAAFNVNTLAFASGECSNTKILNSTGHGSFDEVLLWSPGDNATVFASLLKQDEAGFDTKTYDFEMMVLDDGHSGDVDITYYYFYAEIE